MKHYLLISIFINIILLSFIFTRYVYENSYEKRSRENINDYNQKVEKASIDQRNKETLHTVLQKLNKNITQPSNDSCAQCPDLASYLSSHNIKHLSSDDFLNMLNSDNSYDEYNQETKTQENVQLNLEELFQEAIDTSDQMIYSNDREEAFQYMTKLQILTNFLNEEDKLKIRERIKNDTD